jgi:hypothetical protein
VDRYLPAKSRSLLREAARPDRRARPSSQRALRTKPPTD